MTRVEYFSNLVVMNSTTLSVARILKPNNLVINLLEAKFPKTKVMLDRRGSSSRVG